MTLCEILNELDGNVSVEAGVRLQIGLKRMFSIASITFCNLLCNMGSVIFVSF